MRFFCVGADTGATFFYFFPPFFREMQVCMPHFFFVHKGGETGVSYSLSLSRKRRGKSGDVVYLSSRAEGWGKEEEILMVQNVSVL